MLAVAITSSCVGLQDKIGHPVNRYGQLTQVPVLSARGSKIGFKTCAIAFACFFFWGGGFRFAFRNRGYNLNCGLRKRDLWNE